MLLSLGHPATIRSKLSGLLQFGNMPRPKGPRRGGREKKARKLRAFREHFLAQSNTFNLRNAKATEIINDIRTERKECQSTKLELVTMLSKRFNFDRKLSIQSRIDSYDRLLERLEIQERKYNEYLLRDLYVPHWFNILVSSSIVISHSVILIHL